MVRRAERIAGREPVTLMSNDDDEEWLEAADGEFISFVMLDGTYEQGSLTLARAT